MTSIKEDADKWRRLNSAFRDPVDWRYIRYIAVSSDKEKCDIVDFSTLYPECGACLVRTDNGKLCRECAKGEKSN